MRRDALSIRKRASDDCSFKNSLVFVSRTARYPFQNQPGIRFVTELQTHGWGRRATTPDVATARRRRAADCARREGLPTVDRPSRRTHLPLRTGPQDFTDAATARTSCERERARPARAAAECGGAPGGRPSVSSRRWQGAVVASGRGARRPATASLQQSPTSSGIRTEARSFSGSTGTPRSAGCATRCGSRSPVGCRCGAAACRIAWK
jgi:hypothetical protein